MAVEVVHPRDKAVRGILCGIPTFGMVHAEFAQSLSNQAVPINFGMSVMFVGHTQPLKNVRWDPEEKKVVHISEYRKRYPQDERPPWIHDVGEARNILAQFALDNGLEYLYFRDDDTIAPADAVNKLFSDRLPIVGGHYMSKQEPPHSLILVNNYLAGFEDFRMGEIVKCDNIGMGCTLIHTDVLRAVKEKHGLPWFKTVKCLADNDLGDLAPHAALMTEDVYFCTKARGAGYEIFCDTGVTCQHIDVKSHTKYYWHGGLQCGVWEQYDGSVQWYPKGGHPARASTPIMVSAFKAEQDKAGTERPKFERPLRFDLGAPGVGRDNGYLSVDLYEPADIQCDIRDIQSLVMSYDFPDELRASHVLEHFQAGEVPGTLRNWYRHLRPGGRLLVAIPDFQWAVERATALGPDVDPDDYWSNLAMVYGAQRNPGDLHRCCFNKSVLEKMLRFVGFEIEESWYEQYIDPRVQRSVVVSARKPVHEDDELLPAEGLFPLLAIQRKRVEDVEATARIYDHTEPPQKMMHAFLQGERNGQDGADLTGSAGSSDPAREDRNANGVHETAAGAGRELAVAN